MAEQRRRRRRHHEEEEEGGSERWLVTYADMLTLLMVLFIVMFSMSQVDQKKYNALKDGLSQGFGATSSFMKGSDSILDENLDELTPELRADPVFEHLPEDQKAMVVEAIDQEQRRTHDKSHAEAEAEVDRLEKIRDKIESVLAQHGLRDDVQTTIDERGLVVSLVSRHVVFEPNVADLSLRGQQVVDTLAPVLREITDPLRIDGHTNQVKVHPRYYATDWDLSAARALTVLRRLNEVDAVPDSRLSLSAFGHERPLVDPRIAGSQRVNKRVDIVVLPGVDSDAQALLADVARARPAALNTPEERG